MNDERRTALWGGIAIAVLGASLYASTLSYPFVYDDASSIVQNRGIRLDVADTSSWRALRLGQPTPRPVANASFALNYAAGGLDPAGYRAVNIAIHILASLGVAVFSFLGIGALARRSSVDATSRVGFAVFAGLVFVAHPLATQSVTYVVQRMTSLSTLSYVAALCLWILGNGFNRSGAARLRYRASALLVWALAMGSKEIAATWPVAVWLWEWQVEREGAAARAFARRSVPWALGFGVVGAAVVWAYAAGDPLGGYSRKPFTLVERLWTEPRVWWSYAGLTLLPLPSRLSVIHDVEMSTSLLSPWSTALALGAWLGVVLVSLRSWPRHSALSALALWWLLQQAVEGTVLPLEPMYEHRTYLPMVALCAFLPWGVARAFGMAHPISRSGRAAQVAAAVLVVLALSAATLQRNAVWQSAETLWRDALGKAPGHPRPNTNLGMALAYQQRNEEALEYYRRASELDPHFAEAHHNAGVALHVLGRLEEAKLALQRSLELEPNDRFTHWTLGQVQIAQGEIDAGVDSLERAASLGVEPQLWFELARRRAAQGRLEDAEKWVGYAVALERTNSEMHALLGTLLIARDELARGRGHLGLSLKERDNAVVRALLARTLWGEGEWAAGLSHAERAWQQEPSRPEVIATLAWMLATTPVASARDPKRAIELIRPQLGVGASLTRDSDPRAIEVAAAAFAAAGAHAQAASLFVAALEQSRALGMHGVALSAETELEIVRNGSSVIETATSAKRRISSGSWSPEGLGLRAISTPRD